MFLLLFPDDASCNGVITGGALRRYVALRERACADENTMSQRNSDSLQ